MCHHSQNSTPLCLIPEHAILEQTQSSILRRIRLIFMHPVLVVSALYCLTFGPEHHWKDIICRNAYPVDQNWCRRIFTLSLRMETFQLIVITKFSFFHRMFIKIHLIQNHKENMGSSAKILRQGKPKFTF
jgi:hypothetical protein